MALPPLELFSLKERLPVAGRPFLILRNLDLAGFVWSSSDATESVHCAPQMSQRQGSTPRSRGSEAPHFGQRGDVKSLSLTFD